MSFKQATSSSASQRYKLRDGAMSDDESSTIESSSSGVQNPFI
jgi:hypothetical protein